MKMEYDSGAILASKGYDNTFSLTLTHDDGTVVKNATAKLMVGDTPILGTYDEENECYWFTIPAELTYKNAFYNILVDGETLHFPDKMRYL